MFFTQVLIEHRVWYSDNVKRTHAISKTTYDDAQVEVR